MLFGKWTDIFILYLPTFSGIFFSSTHVSHSSPLYLNFCFSSTHLLTSPLCLNFCFYFLSSSSHFTHTELATLWLLLCVYICFLFSFLFAHFTHTQLGRERERVGIHLTLFSNEKQKREWGKKMFGVATVFATVLSSWRKLL